MTKYSALKWKQMDPSVSCIWAFPLTLWENEQLTLKFQFTDDSPLFGLDVPLLLYSNGIGYLYHLLTFHMGQLLLRD